MYSEILVPEVMASMVPEGFPSGRLSKPQYKVKVDKDVFIEMRDGVRVAVDVYRPDAPGEFPALYASSPYQKDLYYLPPVPTFHMRETNKIEWFVERGFCYVNHDIRGSGKSVEGQWRWHSLEEQRDHYDVIEWIAAQPWCAGKVGMIGESYYAWTQWMAAAQAPPHLACIAPFDGGADMYRDVAYHGGIMATGFPAGWHITELRGHYRVGRTGANPNQGNWDLAWNVINHQTCDDFWQERSPDFHKIACPVFSVGILHKVGIHLRGNLRGYEEVSTPKKLMLCHGDFEGDEVAIFESIEVRNWLLRWYDHWLKGNDTGMMEEPALNIFVRGRERYRRETDWPLPQTRYTKLYLSGAKSGAVVSLNDGSLSWNEPAAGEDSFTYSYPDPDWTGFSGVGTAVMEKGILNPCKKILTFTTPPMAKDTEVIGNMVLVLYAASDQPDTEFLVRIWDQMPDEMQAPGMPPAGRILTRGWLKASHAVTKDEGLSTPYRPYYRHDKPEPIEPGKVYRYEIEIWGTANCFLKGHRLRLDLANGDSNALDFGGHYYGLKVGEDTIYFDKERPSHLVLPIIPEASDLAGA